MDTAATAGVGTKMEPKRMVGLAFVAFTFAGGMFLTQVVGRIMGALKLNDPQFFGQENLTVSSLIAFVVAIGVALALYFNPKVHAGSLDIAAELKKVTWPSLAETRVSTVAVIIASLVSAGILFVFDFLSSKVMTEWVPSTIGWLAKL